MPRYFNFDQHDIERSKATPLSEIQASAEFDCWLWRWGKEQVEEEGVEMQPRTRMANRPRPLDLDDNEPPWLQGDDATPNSLLLPYDEDGQRKKPRKVEPSGRSRFMRFLARLLRKFTGKRDN
jgi:hypothetical protein